MATTTAKLTLTSSDLTSDALNLTTTTTFTGNHTSGLARKAITSTAIGTASGQVTIDTADTYGSPALIYVKNTAAYDASANWIYLYHSGDPDGMFWQIGGGQFCYMPVSGDFTLKAYTSTSGTIVEYIVIGTEA